MTSLTVEQQTNAVDALNILLNYSERFHYFTLTHNKHQWECHLQLAYSGTEYVDKYGQHVVDIYAFAFDKEDPRTAVVNAHRILRERAQAALDACNERPAPKTIAELTAGLNPFTSKSVDDILKELDL